MIMQVTINLNKIFGMAYKTIQHVSVLNLKLFGPMKTELWAKEIG